LKSARARVDDAPLREEAERARVRGAEHAVLDCARRHAGGGGGGGGGGRLREVQVEDERDGVGGRLVRAEQQRAVDARRGRRPGPPRRVGSGRVSRWPERDSEEEGLERVVRGRLGVATAAAVALGLAAGALGLARAAGLVEARRELGRKEDSNLLGASKGRLGRVRARRQRAGPRRRAQARRRARRLARRVDGADRVEKGRVRLAADDERAAVARRALGGRQRAARALERGERAAAAQPSGERGVRARRGVRGGEEAGGQVGADRPERVRRGKRDNGRRELGGGGQLGRPRAAGARRAGRQQRRREGLGERARAGPASLRWVSGEARARS
jgi:hypothetical protein